MLVGSVWCHPLFPYFVVIFFLRLVCPFMVYPLFDVRALSASSLPFISPCDGVHGKFILIYFFLVGGPAFPESVGLSGVLWMVGIFLSGRFPHLSRQRRLCCLRSFLVSHPDFFQWPVLRPLKFSRCLGVGMLKGWELQFYVWLLLRPCWWLPEVCEIFCICLYLVNI